MASLLCQLRSHVHAPVRRFDFLISFDQIMLDLAGLDCNVSNLDCFGLGWTVWN